MTKETSKNASQLPFDLGQRAAFAREDFFVSGSNSAAISWLDKYPAWPSPVLIICGPPACGKTHLLHVWQKEAGAAVFDPASGAEPDKKAFVIDDIDKIIGDAAGEEALFHLYNVLKENAGHALATAATPPAQWPFALADLESRLAAAPVAEVFSPDDQLMAVVLTKLFSDRQIFVPQDVVSFILSRIERSFAALRAVVTAVDHRALAEKRPVTVPLVKDVLRDGV